MENDQIQPGDIVRLKSGGNHMTVAVVETIVVVEWFEYNTGQIMKAALNLNSIEKAQPQGT